MKALLFRDDLPRQAATYLGSRLTKGAFVSPWAPVRLEEVPEPEPPTADWVVCDTVVSGICGSDAKQIFLNGSRDNPLTALISFPHVLGHEAVGRRRDDGRLVLLDPWIGCVPRGIDPPCAACAGGHPTACRNFTRGALRPGIHLGNCATAGGTLAQRFAAHRDFLHPLPEGTSVDAAVLGDPFAVSLHQVLKAPPAPGAGARPVLVYGCGTLGLCAIAILRHVWPDAEVWAVSYPGRTAELARELGAHRVLVGSPDELVRQAASHLGAPPLEPWSRRPWIQDGPAIVYDTVGSPGTVETSLRLLDTGGTIVISGVEVCRAFEWTPLYFKEATVIGSNAYGVEELGGVRKHAYEHYFDLVAAGLDLTPIITHRFPLERWQDAVRMLAGRPASGAVKVLIDP